LCESLSNLKGRCAKFKNLFTFYKCNVQMMHKNNLVYINKGSPNSLILCRRSSFLFETFANGLPIKYVWYNELCLKAHIVVKNHNVQMGALFL
jgi:hypothetical protein